MIDVLLSAIPSLALAKNWTNIYVNSQAKHIIISI